MADERKHLERFNPPEDGALVHASEIGPGRSPRYPDYPYYTELDEGAYAYVREVWRRVRKHQFLILTLAVIITSVVAIEVYRSKSIYRATTTIELDKGSRTVYRRGDLTIESEDADLPYITNIIVKTNVRFLKSRPVLEDIVLALELDKNPRFLDVTGRKSITESIRTITSRIFPEKPEPPPPPIVELPQIESRDIITRSPEESLRLLPYVNVLSANLQAEQVEDTRMLAISFDHTDPVLAAKVVNTTAQVFMDRAYRSRQRRFDQTSDWVTEQTRKLKAQVEEAELNLANFASSNNMVTTGEGKENLTAEKMSNMYGQVLKAEMDRILKESLYEEVKKGNVSQLPEAFGDTKLTTLRTRLDELTVQQAQYAGKYGPENPRVKDLNQQIATLQKQFDESKTTLELRLKADYERALREEKALKDAFERVKAETVAQNQALIQYGMLQQAVEIARGIYQNFLSKSSEVSLQRGDENANRNNARIIEPAFVPGAPIGPNRMRTILIGLLASLVLGVGIALLIEQLDNTVKTVDDVSRVAGLPTLGVIPAMGNRRRSRLAKSNPEPNSRLLTTAAAEEPQRRQLPAILGGKRRASRATTFAEAYRGLRTSILLSSAGHAPKTILFTSSQPSEGKTTTTINTAISLAQLGASVIIVDADMRRPSAHRILGVPQTPGLSTYLSREVELGEMVRELSVPHLSLMPCGPVPPNPAELISSAKMKELLQVLGERYDHVLIDSPPLVNVSDAVILSTLVDGVILVVQGGRSTRGIVRRARIELGNVGAKIFGVVLNNVDLKREGYDGYYYYDRYYGSGYEPSAEQDRASTGGD